MPSADSVSVGDFSLRPDSGLNFENGGIGKLGHCILRSPLASLPALSVPVGHILGWRPEE